MRRRHVLPSVLVSAAALGASGCATKAFVTETVEERVERVEGQVAGIEETLEETSGEVRTNTARLGEVDDTATTALQTATAASEAARGAQDSADDALTLASQLEAAEHQLLFETVIAEEVDAFGFADATLPDASAARLDDLVEQIKTQVSGGHIEIEGHTDATGTPAFNEWLGLKRADAVKRYLHETHQVPLHKMDVVSYGETRPVGANDTREGRAQNRRVVVRVLGTGERVTASAATPEGADPTAGGGQ